MKAIFSKTLKNHRGALIACCVIIIGLLSLFVTMWPDFEETGAEFAELIELYPEDFIKALGIDIDQIFSGMDGFISAEHYSIMWPMTAAIFAIMLGVGVVAGEVDNGTIEILLSQPISRLRTYFAKVLAGITLILLFTCISILAIVPLAETVGVDYDLEGHVTISVLGAMYVFFIYGVSSMASAISSSRGRATFILVGGLIAMYAMNIAAAFKESIEFIKYFSVFYYFDFNSAIFDHQIRLESIVVLLGVGVISLILGAVVFERRDLAV